jgi:heptaprenylglyceryl phosphate synthase
MDTLQIILLATYIIGLVTNATIAFIIKAKDLAIWAMVPVVNTILAAIFIYMELNSTISEHQKEKKEKLYKDNKQLYKLLYTK